MICPHNWEPVPDEKLMGCFETARHDPETGEDYGIWECSLCEEREYRGPAIRLAGGLTYVQAPQWD